MTRPKPDLYKGDGEKTGSGSAKIRPVDRAPLTDPSRYRASPALADAVNVALDLGMPLLLTGEPGCGKSELAASIAWELDFPLPPEREKEAKQNGERPFPEPLRFTVKSDTHSSELFYRFDTLGRFHRKDGDNSRLGEFMTYEALGKAILFAHGQEGLKGKNHIMREADWKNVPAKPLRSVVLIDEIDKAPREVPNDILNEIERLSFRIPELFDKFSEELSLPASDANRPVIVITSNGERPLPKAFLRRCVYYDMQPPDYRGSAAYTVESIVKSRLGQRFTDRLEAGLLHDVVSLYELLRESRKFEKPPNLAELLAWVYYLAQYEEKTAERLDRTHRVFQSSARYTLLKLSKDQEVGDKLIRDWASPRTPD